jgi:hypothetical protein
MIVIVVIIFVIIVVCIATRDTVGWMVMSLFSIVVVGGVTGGLVRLTVWAILFSFL